MLLCLYMKKLLFNILGTTLGLWIATFFIQGVTIGLYPDSNFFGIELTKQWQIFLILGIILGLLDFFVKPILDAITLPLRIITLGLFGFVLDVTLVLAIDIMFKEFNAPWLYPLLYTTLIVWAINLVLSAIFGKKN